MGQTIIAERDQPNVPIGVTVDRDGGITGLTVVFRIYSGADITEFLDFNDGAFKAAGHTTPTQTLTEVGLGLYAVDGGFDLSAITIPAAADSLLVQYEITAGGETGNDTDTISLVESFLDLPTADEVKRNLYDGAIWLSSAGSAGTTLYTNGTRGNPVDTFADAVTLANALGTKTIRLVPSIGFATVSLDADVGGFTIEAEAVSFPIIDLDADGVNENYSWSVWRNCIVTDPDSAQPLVMEGGRFGSSVLETNAALILAKGTEILGTCVPSAGSRFVECFSVRDTVIDFGGLVGTIDFVDLKGDFTFDNWANSGADNTALIIQARGGSLTFGSTFGDGTALRTDVTLIGHGGHATEVGADFTLDGSAFVIATPAIDEFDIAAETVAVAGSTSTSIRTGLTQADDYFNAMQCYIELAGGIVARNIKDFTTLNGAITVDALPEVPAGGERVVILKRVAPGTTFPGGGVIPAKGGNLNGALGLDLRTYTVTREDAPATYVDGRLVPPTTSTFDIAASVQPVSGDDLKALPESQHSENTRKIYTEIELNTRSPSGAGDRLDIDGLTWEVINKRRWRLGDEVHYRLYATRLELP